MDPLGLGASILSVIAWAYWGAAAIALLIALLLPKTVTAKLASVVIVVAVFGYLPASTMQKAKSAQTTFTDSCSKSVLNALDLEPVSGFYAARESLSHNMNFDYAVHYMLERRMTFLETDGQSRSAFLGAVNARDIDQPNEPYVVFYLAKSDDDACHWFNSWSATYPAQKLPALRTQGLLPNMCIGAKGISNLQSRYRVGASLTPISVNVNNYGMWEHMLTITDSASHQRVADFRLFVGHDTYGNRNVLCDKKADAARFNKLVPIVADERYATVSVEVDDEPAPFSSQGQATRQDIEASSDIRGVLSEYATNVIDKDGLTWFETKYIRTDASGSFSLSGYYLVTLRNGILRKTLVRLDGVNIQDFTGLLVTESEVRFVAMNPLRNRHWLLAYSTDGRPKRSLVLSDAQLQALKGG